MKLASLIPTTVLAVLAAGDYQVVRWVPVTTKDDTFVGFPLGLLVFLAESEGSSASIRKA